MFIDDNGDVDFTRSVLLALDRNTSLHHTLPFNLYPGQYRVFVYDIESDGTLYNVVGYPAVTIDLAATIDLIVTCKDSQDKACSIQLYYCFPSDPSQEEHFTCSFRGSSGLILAECSPINSALVTGFQMIAQLSDSSEVHKLHVNQSMDLQTPVTIEVEEDGMYQVTIFAIREGTGIVSLDVQAVLVVSDAITDSTGNRPH